MKALLLKLSAIDSDTEAALRVIAYFDALAMRSATAEMVVRGAAAIAEVPAGLALPDGTLVRFDPAGARLTGEPGDEPRSEQAAGDVRVWIERDGLRGPMDELVLERFALVAKSAPRERSPRAPSELADPSSLELILSESEPEAGRSVALRRLGLSPEAPVVMLAIADPAGEAVAPASVEELLRALAPHVRARGARLGALGAVIVQSHRPGDAEVMADAVRRSIVESGPGRAGGLRGGLGSPSPALHAATAWESARNALRFARARPNAASIVDARDLGLVAHLGSVSAETWAHDPRVRVLVELAQTESGALDVDVLDAYLTLGSLRMAGQALHMHHSSVASRLARLEERLRLDLTLPADLFQARLCLYAATLAGNV